MKKQKNQDKFVSHLLITISCCMGIIVIMSNFTKEMKIIYIINIIIATILVVLEK